MPTGNFDASRVTQNRRNVTLYNWYVTNNAAVNAGASVRREQPNTQLATIVTQRHQTEANKNPTEAPEACPCSQQVVNNSGGNNSRNIGPASG
jgi:hypothetical protein